MTVDPSPSSTVWVQRPFSPVLLALPLLAVVVPSRRRRGKHGRVLETAVVTLFAVALGTLRVVVNREGLRVGFGPWGWPERRFPLRRITNATVESGMSGNTAARDNTKRLIQRLVVGLGYRIVPRGTRIVLGFGDVLVIHLDTGRTFGVTVRDAHRAADLINTLTQEHQQTASIP